MGLEKATKEIILFTVFGGVIGNMLINNYHAEQNALDTCSAIAQDVNPEDVYYAPYYGSLKPSVNDERLGFMIDGGPIYRNSKKGQFQRWETARPEDAISISESCNSMIKNSMDGDNIKKEDEIIMVVTVDKVREALSKRDKRKKNAETSLVSP